MEFESKLVPIMREGVDIIKMVFFKRLKAHLSQQYSDREPSYVSKLSGAIINELFAAPNTKGSFATFAEENKLQIEEEINNIATEFKELCIPLTDALRVQVICDYQEGVDSSSLLTRAKELDILLVEREIPLPKHFLNLVRKLGSSFDLLAPQE
ncbi:MAG: hypothetical protein ABIF87_01315 [Pseudomonadota bacterium]